jgi:hypothetical protein
VQPALLNIKEMISASAWCPDLEGQGSMLNHYTSQGALSMKTSKRLTVIAKESSLFKITFTKGEEFFREER